MEHAKRMVLVDERLVDRFQHGSNWRKPTEQTAKTKLVREMEGHLDEDEISDDVKVKNYNQDLIRFLNVKRQLPNTEPAPVQAPVKTEETAKSVKTDKVRKARKTRKIPVSAKPKFVKPSESLYKSRPKRLKKVPKKFDWLEW